MLSAPTVRGDDFTIIAFQTAAVETKCREAFIIHLSILGKRPNIVSLLILPTHFIFTSQQITRLMMTMPITMDSMTCMLT